MWPKSTVSRHYYQSHKTINPTGIVPAGPVLDFEAPVAPAGQAGG